MLRKREEGDRGKMEFDKSRVYTALNADELRAGDKVIVADTIQGLVYKVKANEGIIEIDHIEDMGEVKRFSVKNKHETVTTEWHLAYLVERGENCTNCKFKLNPECNKSKWPEQSVKVFRCNDYVPQTKQKAENCTNCVYEGSAGCSVVEICGENKSTHRCHMYETKDTKNECDRWKAKPETKQKVEKHCRPFRDTDELIKVWREKSKQVHSEYSLTMPYIWLRRKEVNSKGQLITEFGDELHVSMGKEGYNMTDLFVHFTFLDGSPCGVEA